MGENATTNTFCGSPECAGVLLKSAPHQRTQTAVEYSRVLTHAHAVRCEAHGVREYSQYAHAVHFRRQAHGPTHAPPPPQWAKAGWTPPNGPRPAGTHAAYASTHVWGRCMDSARPRTSRTGLWLIGTWRRRSCRASRSGSAVVGVPKWECLSGSA